MRTAKLFSAIMLGFSLISCFSEEGTGVFGKSHVVVTGHIVDARNGNAVSGVIVELVIRENCSGPPIASPFVFTTNGQGRFGGKLVISGDLGFQRGCISYEVTPSADSGLQGEQGSFEQVNIFREPTPPDTLRLDLVLESSQ